MIRGGCFLLLLNFCESINPDLLVDDDIPLVPPVLFRASTYRPDVCLDLCEEFTAANRGNGFDLCDSNIGSTCYMDLGIDIPYCEFLYWSVAEDGQPGLVYSVNGTDLTEIEAARPLTCQQAGIILGRPSMYTTPPSLR